MSLISTNQGSMPVSVCHIASGERWAGAEAQVATTVKALSRHADVRVCAILTNEGRLAEEIRASGVDVGVFPRQENSFTRILSKSYRFLKDRDVQVLHSHRYKENLLAFLLRSPLGKPRLVRTQHGNPEPAGMKGRLVYMLDRATGCYVDRVISVSSHLEQYLRTYLRPNQITVVRNGIDMSSVHSRMSVREAKQWLGIASDAPVIGTVARLDPVKRHDIFLKTAKSVLGELPNAMFVIAGAGGQGPRLRELANTLGISRQVKFIGHEPRAFDVLRALDILLMTSDHEGLPMVVLEAMAVGAVVVSREVGGIPEAVEDCDTGVLVNSDKPEELAAHCVRLLRDRSTRDALARSAREKVAREFSSEANADQVLAVYRSVLSCGQANTIAMHVEPVATGEGRRC